MRTYTVLMNITLSIDEQLVERAREKLRAMGKSLNQEIRDHLQHIAGGSSQLERDLEFLRTHSGLGHSGDWDYRREDAYERGPERPKA